MSFDFGNISRYLGYFGAFIAILLFGLAIIGLAKWFKKAKNIASRLDQYVLTEIEPDETAKPNKIIAREISGSLFSRTISNWFKNVVQFLGRFTPKKMAGETERKLVIAGKPSNLSAGDFFAVQSIVLVVGCVFAFIASRSLKDMGSLRILIGIIVIMISLFFPISWLNGRVKARQSEIQRGLPDALDMLSVCASAGLGFDQSLQKIVNYWDTDLGLEFKRVTQEMEMGISRSDALRNMSNRLDVNDLTQFVSIMVQAEKIGMSYSNVLHSQALQLRVLRQVRAREMANKLPGKIIIPVILFIFPALIAVILGPAVPIIIDVF